MIILLLLHSPVRSTQYFFCYQLLADLVRHYHIGCHFNCCYGTIAQFNIRNRTRLDLNCLHRITRQLSRRNRTIRKLLGIQMIIPHVIRLHRICGQLIMRYIFICNLRRLILYKFHIRSMILFILQDAFNLLDLKPILLDAHANVPRDHRHGSTI